MKVMKFGGSSVADAKNINKVIDIVLQSSEKNENVAVVVSALGGVTDELIKMASFAFEKDDKYKIIFEKICKRHDQTMEELIRSEDVGKVLVGARKKYEELQALTEKIYSEGPLPEKLSLELLDAVMSFGEQLSAYIVSEAIKNKGIACDFVDSRNLIKTDDNFGSANVDLENSYRLIEKRLGESTLSVMGGFIGSTEGGATTTLSRGGSDYTASLLGAALNASVIEIWTDVDGIMTEDPKKMKDALLIPEITYEKAEEMAYNGAKVIHPKTIRPAVLKNIPIYVKNTFNPAGGGTRISNAKK